MKKRFNKLAGALICIAFAAFMLFLKDKVDVIWSMLCTFASILTPFIYAFAIAYIVNFPYRFFRTKVFGKIDNRFMKKVNKPLSLVLAYLIFLAIIAVIIALVIPQIAENISKFVDNVPSYIKSFRKTTTEFTNWAQDKYNIDTGLIKEINDTVIKQINNLGKSLANYDNITKIISYLTNTIFFLFNWFMAFIISIYMLVSKEYLCMQVKRFCTAFLPTKWMPTLYEIVNVSDDKCGKYLVGKILDSVIYGLLCFIGMVIFDLPYAPLVSVIVGVFNIIPFFGPFLGAVVGSILLLLDSPNACLIFVIISVVLQQLDGNFISPKIVGNQVGLIGFWSLFSVLVGGAMFGVVGMILGTPIFAAIYTLVGRKVNKRVAMKGENAERVLSMSVINKSSIMNVKAKPKISISSIKADLRKDSSSSADDSDVENSESED